MRHFFFIILFMLTTNMVGQNFILQESDKQIHFAAGMVTSAAGYHWSYKKYNNKTRAQITGILTSISAGVLKELYDSRTGGTVERRDVLATMMGGAAVTVIIPLFQKKRK